MNGFRRSSRAAAAIVVILMAGLAFGAATGPAAKNPRIYWIDLSGQAERKPDFVYFTANSGGQVKNIKWKGWGRNRAVGRGYHRDTSPKYPGKLNQNGRARLVASKPVRCSPDFGNKRGRKVYVYRRVKLIYPNGKGGRTRADVSDRAGRATCR